MAILYSFAIRICGTRPLTLYTAQSGSSVILSRRAVPITDLDNTQLRITEPGQLLPKPLSVTSRWMDAVALAYSKHVQSNSQLWE